MTLGGPPLVNMGGPNIGGINLGGSNLSGGNVGVNMGGPPLAGGGGAGMTGLTHHHTPNINAHMTANLTTTNLSTIIGGNSLSTSSKGYNSSW